MNDLYTNFNKYFEIVVADTTELLEHVFRIRYQVLCVEKRLPGFDPEQCPLQQEKDNYDHHSSHVLLRFRPTGEFIGTVRLILFNPQQPDKQFPVELNTQLDPELCNIKELPRQQMAEISRSVVTKQFDRRADDRRRDDRRRDDRRKQAIQVDGDKRAAVDRRVSDRRSTPHLSLLLMAGVFRMSAKYKIEHLLSVTDPALNRLLGYYGLSFDPIGPLVNYHGIRRPYYMNVKGILDKIYEEHRDAWEVVTDHGKYLPLHSN